MRKFKFQNEYCYHIYNRGVDKRNIFIGDKDYIRFIRSMREFNTTKVIDSLYRLDYLRKKEKINSKDSKCPIGHLESNKDNEFCNKLVDIVCYCLNPNHSHFLLKQLSENGISIFLHKLNMGYTKYFNYKYNRSGSLFEGTYKLIHINKDSYLIYLSGYINGNPEIHKICKAENWLWSSYKDYLGLRQGTLSNKNIILKDFKNITNYKNYTNIVIKESRQRKDEIKKYLLE